MMLPHAIVRRSDWAGAVALGTRGKPLHAISLGPLTLLATPDAQPITARDADAYLDAVQQIAEACACVPFRGAEPIEPEAAHRLLRAGEARFTSLLDRLDGHDEWSVNIEDAAAASRAATTPDNYLTRRRDELARADGISPSTSRTAARLVASMTEAKPDTRLFPINEGASLRLLLHRDRAERALDQLHTLATAEGIACTIIGPWPAFSFVSPL